MSAPLLQGRVTKGYSLTSKLVTWRKWTDIPLLVVAIGSLPLLLLEIISHRLTSGDKTFLLIVNLTVFLAYAIDYVVEFLVTPEKGRYVRSEWSSLLIVVAQLFAILPAMSFSSKKGPAPPEHSTVKAKTHFFRNLDLTSVLEPSLDDGVFTGELTRSRET